MSQFAFGAGTLFAVQQQDSSGNAVANATPVQFGTLQDISGDISFEEKMLYGAQQFPVAFGRGKGKLAFKAKVANINGSILGDLLFGNGTQAGIRSAVTNFPVAVPSASPYTLTMQPPSTGTYVNDLGVLNAATGMPLKKVASAPATGQYSVSALGVYTFAAADQGLAVLISYEYSATSTTAKITKMTNQLMGYAPTFKASLALSFGGKNITLVLNKCVSSKFSLPFKNDDFAVPEFDFSALADDAGELGYIATSE